MQHFENWNSPVLNFWHWLHLSTLLIICMSLNLVCFECHQWGGRLIPNGFAHAPLPLGILVFKCVTPLPLPHPGGFYLPILPLNQTSSMRPNKTKCEFLLCGSAKGYFSGRLPWSESLAEAPLAPWELAPFACPPIWGHGPSCGWLGAGWGGCPVSPQVHFAPIPHDSHLSQLPFSWLHQIELSSYQF